MAEKDKKPNGAPAAETAVRPGIDPNRQKALDAMLLTMEKEHGKGVVQRLGDNTKMVVHTISTGSIAIDLALGVGGLPRGRITEIYGAEASGKTTIALQTVAAAQKAGGVCAYVDVEHALDPEYARKLGVDIDALYISQPDSGEQALSVMESFINSGAVDVVVLDSIAALVPRAELEGDMGDSHVGLQARLMSQALRKIAGTINKTKTVAIFINQLRSKIGVMFGCFHGNTQVTMADGQIVSIRDIVRQKLPGPVLTYNPKSDRMEPAPIVNWFENGNLNAEAGERWLSFKTSSAGGIGGTMGFTCTPNHLVMLESGEYVPAEMLHVGDRLLSWYESRLEQSRLHLDMVMGSLLGDGALRLRDIATAAFSLANQEQPDYLAWKMEKLRHLEFRRVAGGRRVRYDSQYSTELACLRPFFYPPKSGFRSFPPGLQLTPLMAAIWWMDDGFYKVSHNSGHISIKRWFREDCTDGADVRRRANEALARFCGDWSPLPIKETQKSLHLSPGMFRDFCAQIAPFVPPCMQYKLPEEFRGQYQDFDPGPLPAPILRPLPVSVVAISEGSHKKQRQPRKFDLEIANHHAYLVGGGNRGVVVHNSPETTAGGNAMKYYASVRLDVRRIETLKNGTDPIGARIKCKVVKNKVAPPFKQAEYDILFGRGINNSGSVLDLAVEHGLVQKSGAFYSYGDQRLGQGRENTRAFLEENESLLAELEARVRAKIAGAVGDAAPDKTPAAPPPG